MARRWRGCAAPGKAAEAPQLEEEEEEEQEEQEEECA
jgi:hypothetical protein